MTKQELFEWMDRFDASKATGLRYCCTEFTLELTKEIPLPPVVDWQGDRWNGYSGSTGRQAEAVCGRNTGEEDHVIMDSESGGDPQRCQSAQQQKTEYQKTEYQKTGDRKADQQNNSSGWMDIKAPLAGIYYEAPSPGSSPFVTVGQKVEKGQPLCLLEAMKMMNEVTAPRDCVVEQIYCQDGELVGFDAPLLAVRPV